MPMQRQPVATSARRWPVMVVPEALLTALAAAAHGWRPMVPEARRMVLAAAAQHYPKAVENFVSQAADPA